jgi:CDP-4-dehydro-6-deoxyglucose reductase, E3
MRLTVGQRHLDLDASETVLQALDRHGIELPAACRSGVCQACLVQAVHGNPGPASRAGLRDSLTERGFFLACKARPAGDLIVALAGDEAFTPAAVQSIEFVTGNVLRVWLTTARPLEFRAGQHIALRRPGGITRVYSIANRPADAAEVGIELHVRFYEGGAMSSWLARAQAGAMLSVGTPAGSCWYRPDDGSAPLLLAGTGTGIAPLIGIARDAVSHRHRGPIVILHGVCTPDGHYLDSLMDSGWPRQVRVRTCTLSAGQDITQAALEELAAMQELAAPPEGTGLDKPAAQRAVAAQPGTGQVIAYLCGGPGAVHRTRRALFLAGMPIGRIHADLFRQAAPPAVG